MNDARDAGAAAFKVDRVQKHSYAFKSENKFAYLADKNHAIPVNVYIGVDLAATASETSDYQVILVMAIDSNQNRYVLEYFRERIPTFDVPAKIIEMTKKYHPVKRVTIETVAAQEMVRDMVTRLSAKERRLMPGVFKGVKPPPGIKKQDRLETTLGPIINSKKLYIREEMTELVDEIFEHPKPRNDDLMDGLYYADYFARSPKSKKMDVDDYEEALEERIQRPTAKVYNWITGSKI
jgi:phage terminase large subunit-like protein